MGLVYAGDPLLDSDFLTSGGDLQDLFEQTDRALTLRQEEDEAQDTLLLGLDQEAEEAEPYLAAAQVTLHFTPTQRVEEEEPAEKPAPTPSPSPAATETLTGTPSLTPTLAITETPEVEPEADITLTVEISPAHKNRIEIESVGDMVLTGTSLLLLSSDGERDVLVVLANTEAGLADAVERLATGNLDDCLLRETTTPTPTVLALCPTGEVTEGEGAGGWQEPEPPPSTSPPLPTPEPPLTDTEPLTETVPPPTPEPSAETRRPHHGHRL